MLEEAFARAEAALAAAPKSPLLFLGAEGWHKGLLGLIASRITDRFHLPSFVAALEPDGMATGSARSITSVDLGTVVRDAVHQGLLIKGGGHTMAAGFKLERAEAEDLANSSRSPRRACAERNWLRQLAIDGALSARGRQCRSFMELMDRAGPYGAGHPEPRFVFPAHRVSGCASSRTSMCAARCSAAERRPPRGVRLPRRRHAARPSFS